MMARQGILEKESRVFYLKTELQNRKKCMNFNIKIVLGSIYISIGV